MQHQKTMIPIFTKIKSIMFLLFLISVITSNLSSANEENLIKSPVATSEPTSSPENPETILVSDDTSNKMDSEDASMESKNNNNSENQISLTQRAMPVYGNWCGANHPKDMSIAEEPIDLLDQSCKKHDHCYADEGYLSCACDNVINQELIAGLKENKFGKTEAVVARSFHLYFNGSPCNGDHSTKVAPSRLIHNVVKKASDRTVDVLTSLPIVGDTIEKKLSD